MNKKFAALTVAATLIVGLTASFAIAKNTSAGIVRAKGEPEPAGQRLVISFTYEKLNKMGSNQFAFWVEDMDGNYVNTLYATKFTAQKGHETRPSSLRKWVAAAKPGAMQKSEIDAISSATPKAGDHYVVWDFKDKNGKAVTGKQYRYFIEASLNFDRGKNDGDNIIYTGEITAGDTEWKDTPKPTYSSPSSADNVMIKNVSAAYYPK